MIFRIGQMKTKDIVNGIFITGLGSLIIVTLNILIKYFLSMGIPEDSPIMYLLDNRMMYSIRTIAVPIIFLISFKLLCEALYKIVKASEIIIEKYNNK
ncbi:hypothetical protein [Candidatus Clostridium stratigraminis]|uniref:Tripartite ATP-independent periplasmic transporter, DctQ component n=1 Tax=Candidatus Clostridium stratigraminis TaxID=3381661 RepID=A0ABW8T8A9_9CLOT